MTEPAPNPELLRSLGRLVRGLSALFWGLPLALIIGMQTARTDWLRPFNIIPPVAASSLLFYGLCQLGHFHPHERIWTHALDRAKLLGAINIGLSPFLYWWYQAPRLPFFLYAVGILALSGIGFLYDLNQVLRRLTAMLPDATLRHETQAFTTMNMGLLAAAMTLFIATFLVLHSDLVPYLAARVDFLANRVLLWLMIFLILLPVAMTMAMIWKVKETILSGVFGAEG